MLLGSHNSLTYLTPTKWYLRPFHFMAKCQSVNYKEQYEKYGIRVFDLRIWFDENGKLQVRHGIIQFKADLTFVSEFLDYLNKKKDCYVRIMLEEDNILKKKPYAQRNEMKFLLFCERLEEAYFHIKFFGGNRKFDEDVIYHFKSPEPPIMDRYSSTTRLFGKRNDSNWINRLINQLDDLWPWLYAKIHNKSLLKKHETEDVDKYLFFDFVNIR